LPTVAGRTGSEGVRRAVKSSPHPVIVDASASTSTKVHARGKFAPEIPIRRHGQLRTIDPAPRIMPTKRFNRFK
jgi:hypothetical protein